MFATFVHMWTDHCVAMTCDSELIFQTTPAGNGASENIKPGAAAKAPPGTSDASQKEGLTGTPAGSAVESATSRYSLPKPTLAVRNLVCHLVIKFD